MKAEVKDLKYYECNAQDDYLYTPISVLRYIKELEEAIQQEREKWKEELINIIDNIPFQDPAAAELYEEIIEAINAKM